MKNAGKVEDQMEVQEPESKPKEAKAKALEKKQSEYEKNKIIEDQEWEELWLRKKEYLDIKKYEKLK